MTVERWNATIFNWKGFIFSISEVFKTNLFPWDLDRKDSTLNVRSLRDYYFALSFDWPSLFKLMILLITFLTNKSDFRTDFFYHKVFFIENIICLKLRCAFWQFLFVTQTQTFSNDDWFQTQMLFYHFKHIRWRKITFASFSSRFSHYVSSISKMISRWINPCYLKVLKCWNQLMNCD